MLSFLDRLTTIGKALVLAGLALVFAVGYFLFFHHSAPPPAGPDLTLPAPLGRLHYPFRNDADRKAFDARASTVPNYCSFFTNYAYNRGLPVRFDAYIANDPTNNPYYLYDQNTGIEYLPAYYVSQGGHGLTDALTVIGGDDSSLPACAGSTGTGGIILLGFPRAQRPLSPLVHVEGTIWWDSTDLAAKLQAPQAASNGQAPVVRVGAYSDLSPRQSADPALVTRRLGIAIQTGAGVLRLGRIEYGAAETRLWVSLSNRSNSPLPPWQGPGQMQLQPAGGATLSPDDSSDPLQDQTLPDTINDLLPSQPIQPGPAGRISGYVIFPKVDPAREQYLYVPPVGPYNGPVQNPIVVRIPPTQPAR